VIKIYEDYDKTERIAWKMEAAKDEGVYRRERRIYELSQAAVSPDGRTIPLENKTPPFQAPFRHFCNLIQIADGDIDKAIAAFGAAHESGAVSACPSPEQIPLLRARGICAKYWVENCAPEEFRFRLKSAGERAELSDAELQAIRLLRDDVISRIETFDSDKPCAEAIYAVAEKAGIDGKALFRTAYQSLIGKDQGPRLASFLRSIEKERLLNILKAY
jgi:lysyl-tRNA synthetase class 1